MTVHPFAVLRRMRSTTRPWRRPGLTGSCPARPGGADAGVTASRWADAGMATAEYAVATLAACGFAALLLTLLRSGEVRAMLAGIIRRALSVG